jgi:hypothetical protein
MVAKKHIKEMKIKRLKNKTGNKTREEQDIDLQQCQRWAGQSIFRF